MSSTKGASKKYVRSEGVGAGRVGGGGVIKKQAKTNRRSVSSLKNGLLFQTAGDLKRGT